MVGLVWLKSSHKYPDFYGVELFNLCKYAPYIETYIPKTNPLSMFF